MGGIILKKYNKTIALILILAVFIPCLTKLGLTKSFGVVLSKPEDFDVTVYQSYNQLEWTNTNKGFTFILIERSVDQGAFYPLTTIRNDLGIYKDYSVLNGHIYTYRIKANLSNDSSAYTPEKEVVTIFPTNLKIDKAFSNQVDLEWETPELALFREVNYKTIIERRENNEQSWSVLVTLPATQTIYRDTDLKDGTYYRYRIRMQYDKDIYSNYSPSAYGLSTLTTYALTTPLWGHGLPDGKIALTWDISRVDSQARVIIERISSIGANRVHIVTADKKTYIDTDVLRGETYTYRLCLQTVQGRSSEYTGELEITAEHIPPIMAFEANPVAANQVVLTWDYPYEVETGFEIWRQDQDAPEHTSGWIKLATIPKNMDTYYDKGVISQKTYKYKIRAYRGDNTCSAFSPDTSVTIAFPDQIEPIVAYTSDHILHIFSHDRAPQNTSYTLQTKDHQFDEWKNIRVRNQEHMTYSTRFDSQTHRYYRIRANALSLESFSPEFEFFGSHPKAPTSVRAPHVGHGRVVLEWNDETEKELGYNIYRTINGEKKLIGSAEKNVQIFIDQAPLAGADAYYEVCAYNLMGESAKNGVWAKVPRKAEYKDTAAYPWAQNDIYTLQGFGAFGHSTTEYFYPQSAVTRGELAHMIIKSFNMGYDTSGIFPLSDITVHNKYYDDLTTLYKLGIMHPDHERRIFPQRYVTRQEVLVVLSNVLGHLEYQLHEHDVEILTEYSDYHSIENVDIRILASFVGEKIITGKSQQRLALSAYAAKIEVVAFVYRTLIRYRFIG